MKCYISNQEVQFQEMEEKLMEGNGGEMQQVCVHPSISYQQILGMGGSAHRGSRIYICADERGKTAAASGVVFW